MKQRPSILDTGYARLFDAVEKTRWWCVTLVALVLIGALLAASRLEFDNQVETVLPGDEEVLRNIRFLRESNLSDTIMVSLRLVSEENDLGALIPVADAFADSLTPPMISKVDRGIPQGDLIRDMLAFSDYSAQVVDAAALKHLDSQLNEEAVRDRLRGLFKQMMGPSSAAIVPFIRSDPMGIKSNMLQSLENLAGPQRESFSFEGGHLVSPDRRHILLLLHTPVPVTDGFAARELIEYLQRKVQALPDFVAADMVAAHFHAVSNEDVIRRDIKLTLSIAAIGFFLLFLLVFRDVRAVMIFLIPLTSVAISIPLAACIMGPLSYFIIGMGAVVAGISVDYGIHVYVAVVHHHGDSKAARLVFRPVIIGALTTISVFAAFLFSNVRGYHQLAAFAISSIVICLLLALGLFPHLLRGAKRLEWKGIADLSPKNHTRRHDLVVIGIWIAILAVCLIRASFLEFDSDIRQFDGSEESILAAEDRLNETWGDGASLGVLVVEAEDFESALASTESLVNQARETSGVTLSTLTDVWPSREVRRQNAADWAAFWRAGREDRLHRLLIDVGQEFHFAEKAFDPFFSSLYDHLDPKDSPRGLPVFDRILSRFIYETEDGVRLFAFFEDRQPERNVLKTLCDGRSDAFCVSRIGLSESLNRSVTSEIGFLASIAASFIPLLTFLLLRNPLRSILALVPVVTSLAVVLGVLNLLGLSLNAPSLIATLVVLGLSIDYGIFMVYACHFRHHAGTPVAVTLSAWTTLIGAGVLVFAQHPLLFYIGVTLVSGVTAGYLTANLVVPPLYRLTTRPGKEG